MFAATVIESPCTWTGIASSRVVRVIPRSGAANAIRRARRLGGCDELSDRQRSRVSSSGGSPTSVNGASTRASPPESRSTGAAWPSCENLESGAASSTGTRLNRSSFAIASTGTAKLAWSRSPCASVSRYAWANSAKPRLTTRKVTATAAYPGLRASDSAASRNGTGARRPQRSASRSAGASSRAVATAATNAISPGSRIRKVPVPPPATSDWASADPRASASSTAPSAPIASASNTTGDGRMRRTTKRTSAATTTAPVAVAIPPPLSAEWERIVTPSRRSWCATGTTARQPMLHPTTPPARATAIASATLSTTSCHVRAPNHVSRRHVASASRRRRVAASTVNASSSAAASPPIKRSRRPAMRLSASAFATASVGAVTSNCDECADSSERARSTSVPKRPASQGCTRTG